MKPKPVVKPVYDRDQISELIISNSQSFWSRTLEIIQKINLSMRDSSFEPGLDIASTRMVFLRVLLLIAVPVWYIDAFLTPFFGAVLAVLVVVSVYLLAVAAAPFVSDR